MSERAERILRLALEKKHHYDSKFYVDFCIVFVYYYRNDSEGSSDNVEYDSNASVSGPPGHSTSKRPRLGSECPVDEEHEDIDSQQHSDVEIQHDDNSTPEEE
ncbi:hypothetical protein JTB14_002665 [Gonioctena quinquepunctata]|nr:hypothetical protein JTB14_002665 [Gonioctena quinquepunctata]